MQAVCGGDQIDRNQRTGGVTELAESTSQGWSLTPVKVSDPPPVFMMLTLAGVRLDEPVCAEKLKFSGLTFSTGADGFTVRVTSARLLASA